MYLKKWTEGTEEVREMIPALKKSCLKLERNCEQSNDYICQGKVGNEEVCDRLKKNVFYTKIINIEIVDHPSNLELKFAY